MFGQFRFSETSGDLVVATVAEATCAPNCAWDTNGTGLWNDIDNWQVGGVPGVPDSNDEGAVLGGTITSSATVVVDTDTTVNSVQFDNFNSYVVAGSKTLTFESGTPGGPPTRRPGS